MRALLLSLIVVFLMCSFAFADDEYVWGYDRDSDGDGYKETHVDGYHRSKANNNPYDNYSTKGNTNPYTGEKGYTNPYRSNQGSYNSGYGNSYRRKY